MPTLFGLLLIYIGDNYELSLAISHNVLMLEKFMINCQREYFVQKQYFEMNAITTFSWWEYLVINLKSQASIEFFPLISSITIESDALDTAFPKIADKFVDQYAYICDLKETRSTWNIRLLTQKLLRQF